MTIDQFIRVCDEFCSNRGVSRVWLSKRLLNDTYRIDKLAAGTVDIGVKRLERAVADLQVLNLRRAA